MKVNKIHPDEAYKEKLDYILSLTMTERLIRHKLLIDKLYEGKPRMSSFDGCVVRKIKP
jgi:hypothetical protein